jgi:hypothetical protein
MFTIDGIEYNVACSIDREAEIKISDISGMLLNGQIFNDVLGTYMTYDIKLTMPLRNKDRYAALIEQLTEPVDGHLFVLPYNNGTIQITGFVEKPADVREKLPSGYTFWKGLQFTIRSNGPSKQMTTGEVIQRGMTPLPDVTSPVVGTVYTWTGTGWSTETYADADDTGY